NRSPDYRPVADVGRQRFTRRRQGGGPLVVPDRARVCIHGPLDADFLRQEIERSLQFEACSPIDLAAPSVAAQTRRCVSWLDAGGRNAANQIRPHVEMADHARVVTAPALQISGLGTPNADDSGQDFMEAADVDAGANEFHVTANAGKILPELAEPTAGR